MSKALPKVPIPLKTIKDYKIPSNIRDELELPAYLFTCALEKWGNSSELLNPYFDLPMIIPNNGYGVLSTATSALNKIKNHKEVLQSVKTYCNRLEAYFKKKIVKDQFIAIYKLKELEWREKRSENNLNSEAKITSNNILAKIIHNIGEENTAGSSQVNSKDNQQDVEGQMNNKVVIMGADEDVLRNAKKPDTSSEGDNELDIGDNRVVTPLLVSSSTPATPSSSSSSHVCLQSEKELSVTLKQPGVDRLLVNGTDISELFYQMQQNAYQSGKTNSLTLETDVHLILSLSSILLLQNNNRLHQDWIPFLGNGLYRKTRDHVIKSLNCTCPEFSTKLLVDIIDIVSKVYRKNVDRLTASASLLSLASNTTDTMDKKLIMSVMQLIQFLPMDPTYECISETTYITRYILPMIQPLFDDHDKNIRLDFTFTEPADKSPTHAHIFNGNPDCIVASFMHETDNCVSIGYGEVKPLTTANNHYLVNWDLVRLGMFGKNTINQNKLRGSLSIHVVAPHIIYYIMQLNADGLYTMTELLRVQCPMSISELSGYVAKFSQVKEVLDVFETHCIPKPNSNNNNNNNNDNNINNESWQRDSLLGTDITLILDKTRNRKRKNTTGHYPSK
ncbi:hypothetical protein G6F43_007561 [Rhizopus delemar]|nr:hypothetical protein G6F43_007561 [Rhizopus delemar]